MPPNLGGFFMVRSYYPSECHADYFDFERIEALKPAIEACGIHETNINIIARRTGKDVNSHTVLDGIITTIMATIQRINIIGSREGSRNRRRLKANQTGKK